MTPKPDNPDPLTTSATGRLLKIGGLMSRIGLSMAGSATANLFRTLEARQSGRLRSWQRNARRVAETLGQLKGVPMKIGQMLSLNEGLLPPEVAAIFRSLQQDAPAVEFSVMQDLLRRELGPRFDRIQHIHPRPHAAASIGQVHRARLRNGRQVVFKIQYPGIDQVLRADMQNLKGLLKGLLGLFTQMDLEPIWQEMNARLLEEIDYRREADQLLRMGRLWRGDAQVRIPGLVRALSTEHVLCMSYEKGWTARRACGPSQSRRLRDLWGRTLFRLFLTGVYEHRFLHADPNLANFAFRPDGSVVVFDFGCMKKVPVSLSRGYARLTRAVLSDRYQSLPGLLRRIGVTTVAGDPLPQHVVGDYADVLRQPFDPPRRYRFLAEDSLYDRMVALGRQHWEVASETTVPGDVVFIDRTIAGHLGNLARLESTANWRKLLDAAVGRALFRRSPRPRR